MVRTKGCAVRFLAPRELPRGVTLHSGQRRDAPALPFDLPFTGPEDPAQLGCSARQRRSRLSHPPRVRARSSP